MAVEYRNGLKQRIHSIFRKTNVKAKRGKRTKEKRERHGYSKLSNTQLACYKNDFLRKRERKKMQDEEKKRKIIMPNGTNSMDEIPGHTRYTQYFPFY